MIGIGRLGKALVDKDPQDPKGPKDPKIPKRAGFKKERPAVDGCKADSILNPHGPRPFLRNFWFLANEKAKGFIRAPKTKVFRTKRGKDPRRTPL